MLSITKCYPAGSLFDRYRGKGIDCVDVDCLDDGLRAAEKDGRVAGDVCLYPS